MNSENERRFSLVDKDVLIERAKRVFDDKKFWIAMGEVAALLVVSLATARYLPLNPEILPFWMLLYLLALCFFFLLPGADRGIYALIFRSISGLPRSLTDIPEGDLQERVSSTIQSIKKLLFMACVFLLGIQIFLLAPWIHNLPSLAPGFMVFFFSLGAALAAQYATHERRKKGKALAMIFGVGIVFLGISFSRPGDSSFVLNALHNFIFLDVLVGLTKIFVGRSPDPRDVIWNQSLLFTDLHSESEEEGGEQESGNGEGSEEN